MLSVNIYGVELSAKEDLLPVAVFHDLYLCSVFLGSQQPKFFRSHHEVSQNLITISKSRCYIWIFPDKKIQNHGTDFFESWERL